MESMILPKEEHLRLIGKLVIIVLLREPIPLMVVQVFRNPMLDLDSLWRVLMQKNKGWQEMFPHGKAFA